MRNLTLEDSADIISGLRIVGHHIHCPICDRAMMTSENPATSALWTHFMSKKHDSHRPLDPAFEDALFAIIKRTSRAAKKAERDAASALKTERSLAAVAENKRVHAKHTVSGGFLDEIVSEMESLIAMMEPYYSQGNGAADARAKIAEIRAISGQSPDA